MKNKLELDALSKQEFMDYRYKFLGNTLCKDFNDKNQYILELEFYKDVRFKEDMYDRYDRWIANKKDPETKFLAEILEEPNGKDSMYYLHLTSELKRIKSFIYIIGIDFNIPNDFILLLK